MHMKWFRADMSPEEVRQTWKTLARKYHPDAHVGQPDHEECEEIFKEISNEYTQLVKGEVAQEQEWFDEEGATQELYDRLNLVDKLVSEIYPRIKVSYWAYLITPTLEFLEPDVPISKVMAVVEIAQKVLEKARIIVQIHRSCRKKVFTCEWVPDSKTLCVDVDPKQVPTHWAPRGSGRRYKEYECLRYECIVDTKSNISYVKVKSPALDFRKDFLKL